MQLSLKISPWLLPIIPGFVCLVLAGCGPAVQDVTGTITEGGKKIGNAEILFQSTDDKSKRFVGNSISDGTYQLDYRGKGGMPFGKYKVTIKHYTLPDGKPLPQGKAGEQAFALIEEGKAKQVIHTFDRQVTSSSSVMDFDLKEGEQ